MKENSEHPQPELSSHAAHERLAHQTAVVLRMGMMMLAAGASSYRVKDSMAELARAVGIERIHAQVTYTEISLTSYANNTFRTEVVEQRTLGVNSQRIDALDHFISVLPDRDLLVEEAHRALDRIEAKKPLYPVALSSLYSGLACAGFAFLNRGGVSECVAVFMAALLGQATRRFLMKHRINHFGVWFVCAIVASAVYITIIASVHALGYIDASHQTGVAAAILFLVPGFPLVTAILDLIRQDFSAGISRSVYVGMLMLSSATAVWGVTTLLDWSTTNDIDGYSLSTGVLIGARALASFVAAFGFATLFNAPIRACWLAALNGAFINTFRLTVQDAGFSWLAAVGFAALLAGLIAAFAAKHSYHSRVSLSVPAVVLMIPGVPFYRAISAINNGQVNDVLGEMITIFLVIAAIGAGLAGARMLTDRTWLTDVTPGLPILNDSESTIPAPPKAGWQTITEP